MTTQIATTPTNADPLAGIDWAAAAAHRARAASAAGIAKRHGQYLHADGFTAKRKLGKHTITIGIAGALDANGLIGPEFNGLFVISETAKRVLTDRDEPQQSGYHGPSAAQIRLFEQVKALPAPAFRRWLQSTDRFRGYLPPVK